MVLVGLFVNLCLALLGRLSRRLHHGEDSRYFVFEVQEALLFLGDCGEMADQVTGLLQFFFDGFDFLVVVQVGYLELKRRC